MAATIIQVKYPGGLEAFKEAGGNLAYIPDPVDRIVVGPSGILADTLKSQLKETLEGSLEFSDHVNINLEHPERSAAADKIAQWLGNELGSAAIEASLAITSTAGVFCLPMLKKGSRKARRFETMLRQIPGHALSFVIYGGGTFTRVKNKGALHRVGSSPLSGTGECSIEVMRLRDALKTLEKSGDWDSFFDSI